MKVVLINGSPRTNSNDGLALLEMKKIFEKENIEVKEFSVGTKVIRGCIACGKCKQIGRCVFDDLVNEVAKEFESADGLVVSSPVYYAQANGTLVSLLQRLFYSTNFSKRMKVGCAIAVARRSGTTATFDELNKYFSISEMPIVTSFYWNNLHGMSEGEAIKDEEGISTVKQLAKNMIFLMKAIKKEKENGDLEHEKHEYTNFIKD